MMQDFKFAVRQLLKTPGFTSVAVLTLALAIGVNSAIFALINGVLLKPVVPVRPAEVVNVFTARQNASHDYRQFSYNEYRDLRENRGEVFVDVAALEFAVAGIGRDHEMRRSFAFLTSENYFPMMGVQAFRGRFYNAEECKPNANMAVLVSSYGFWKRNGGRDDFVGSTLHINGQPYTVIGIAPDGFSGSNALIAPDIWLPLGIRSQLGSAFGDAETTHDLLDPKNHTFNLVARMRSGLTIDPAKARLPVLAQRLNAIQPDGSEGSRELQIQKPARFGLSTQPEDDGPLTLIATLLFSLGPALKATKADLVKDLKEQVGEPARIGRLGRFFAPRHVSVMAQIALSLMLLFAAGLFFRGALKAAGLNPGFVARGDIISEFDFSLIKKTPADSRRLIFDLVRRIRELPGVTASATGTMLPYSDFTTARRVLRTKDAMPNDPKAPDPSVNSLFTAITPGYYEALGIQLLRGRDFTQQECENKDARRVAIIDEEMAKKLFPNEDPIGQHLRYTQPPKDGSPNDMEIVGVVSRHRHSVDNDSLVCRLFVPLAQAYSGQTFLHVRLNTQDRHAVAAFIPTLRQALRQIDPDLPLLQITPFLDLMERSPNLWIVKLGATLFGAFGAIALMLAVVGVYGVKAYAVACRTREIGIRMALGAHRRHVFALIMRQGAMQTALAVGAGLLLSLAAGRVLAKILYDVSLTDPLALVTATLMLASAALLACFFPANRATRVNPMTALRTE